MSKCRLPFSAYTSQKQLQYIGCHRRSLGAFPPRHSDHRIRRAECLVYPCRMWRRVETSLLGVCLLQRLSNFMAGGAVARAVCSSSPVLGISSACAYLPLAGNRTRRRVDSSFAEAGLIFILRRCRGTSGVYTTRRWPCLYGFSAL